MLPSYWVANYWENSFFPRLINIFQHENLSWNKRVAVTTDGAAAMIGKRKDAIALVKQRSPNCEFLHYIPHHEALACKKLKTNSSNETSELDKTAPINSRLNLVVRSPAPLGLGRNGCWPSRESQLPRALTFIFRYAAP